MNSNTLKQTLIDAGYRIGPTIKRDTGVTWYAYKRLAGATDCACNDKPPSLVLQPYDMRIGNPDRTIQNIEFEIAGETASGGWVNFTQYGGNTWENVLEQAQKAENVLRRAWEAVAGV